ncbi:MAG: phage shock protein operon transcriptional activator [Pseudomonadota bacterium]
MTRQGPDIALIGQSPAFLDLLDKVSHAAPLDRPVLIIGERGTGKELVAARLHYLSRRWDRPYAILNCAALAESLLDSELFGHEAGAFTGATRARSGRFEASDGGTLFLDEIASMSPATQEKLLRVIEYGVLQRVGGNETINVDVRIIAAANVDLPALAAMERFRADLLDRLSFDVLTLPPLRHRRDDILTLAQHFARAFAAELGWTAFPGFAPAAQSALMAYDWPGNVRQLKNVVERAVYRAGKPEQPIAEVVFDPFASPYRPCPAGDKKADADKAALKTAPAPAAPLDLRAHLAAEEKRLLKNALEACRFNQRAAAVHLHLSYDQLRHALKKHGLLGTSAAP